MVTSVGSRLLLGKWRIEACPVWRPVMSEQREGMQTGLAYAFMKRSPWLASRSRFSVGSRRFWPHWYPGFGYEARSP